MKAFKEWLGKQPILTNNSSIIGTEDKIAKQAWKAALEWALSNRHFCEDCGMHGKGYSIDAEILEEELQDE